METNSSFRKEVCESFNTNSDDYDGELPVSISSKLKDCIYTESNLTKEDAVLDLTCCTGTLINFIDENYGCDIYGIYSSNNIIELCKNKVNKSSKIMLGETYNIPYEDEKFNLVTSTKALHSFKDTLKSFEEIYRVLKPDGKVILEHVYYISPIKKLINKFIKNKSGSLKSHSLEDIKEMLYVIGFKEVTFKKNEMFSYIIIANK